MESKALVHDLRCESRRHDQDARMMSAAATNIERSNSKILELERTNHSLRERIAYLQNRVDEVCPDA